MHTRSFRVLDEDDDPLVDRLAAGLGRTPARVLAYLLLRADAVDGLERGREQERNRDRDPTTTVHLQVGTDRNRTTISDATSRLESRGLVDRSTVREHDSAPGRPQTAWSPTADIDETVRRVYAEHARALLDLAVECHDVDAASDRAERSGQNTEDVARESPVATSSAVELALNWSPNALQVPIYAALEGDWYDTSGVDVRLDHRDGSRRALERVSSGAADVAIAGAATVVRARAAGDPVVPVAVLYQRAMTVLYTVREAFGEPLVSVAQLENRRIGMPPSSETRLLGRLFLSQTDFSEDVRIVDTNGEERDALRRGDADVVTGSVADPRQLERESAGGAREGEGRNGEFEVDVLQLTDHFPIYGPTIVVREETLVDRSPALTAFLAGTTAGWAEARQNAKPAAERIAGLSDSAGDAKTETETNATAEAAADTEAGNPAERIATAFDRAATDFGESDVVRDRGWGWQRRSMWERLQTALDQAEVLA